LVIPFQQHASAWTVVTTGLKSAFEGKIELIGLGRQNQYGDTVDVCQGISAYFFSLLTSWVWGWAFALSAANVKSCQDLVQA